MLVLTRKSGEAICIGDEIELVITEITKGSVRVGIKAPKDTLVYRKEVYDRILLENQEASHTVIENSQLIDLNALISKRISKHP
ncbi:MAG: carbon storage regulator CsrA [Candidatus Cloacimonetes bacterium]|nr:carbon storage regulator CsrA [Candidatus Cloacimonadota bacterium]